MTAESRTKKSIKNSVIALLYFVIQFILAFYSRKVFLQYLGVEILGLNTTAMNILQFLNLAELGITSAVSFSLYNPLHHNEENTINEIVTLQGQLYKRIACIIIGGAIVVMCFFPLIFKKTPLPLWYAYSSFSVLLYSALLGYFVNYKQIILTASQKDYRIQTSTGTVNIIKTISQIIFMSYMPYPYIWWLILEVVFSTISSFILSKVIKNTFPFLKDVSVNFKQLKDRYPTLLVKTKQVFFHNIGTFTLSQTSPLIIYAYSSLSVVTLYGNYQIIVIGIRRLINAVFNSIGAGIGNLIAEGNNEKIMKVFYELFSLRFLISSTLSFSLIILGQSFIILWIGSKYLLSITTLMIMACTLFINLNRYTVGQFLMGRGQYQDILSPLIEAGINILLSVILGYYFGLNGILSGVLISLIIMVELWKPYFLFRYGFKLPVMKYYMMYITHIVIGIMFGLLVYRFALPYKVLADRSYIGFILFAVSVVGCYFILLALGLAIISQGFRNFLFRVFKKKFI